MKSDSDYLWTAIVINEIIQNHERTLYPADPVRDAIVHWTMGDALRAGECAADFIIRVRNRLPGLWRARVPEVVRILQPVHA